MRHLLFPIYSPYLELKKNNLVNEWFRGEKASYLIYCRDIGTQATMNTEYSSIHYRSQRKIVKHFTTISPYIRAPIFSLTFVVKSVDLRDLTRFVVPSYKRNTIRIANFEG